MGDGDEACRRMRSVFCLALSALRPQNAQLEASSHRLSASQPQTLCLLHDEPDAFKRQVHAWVSLIGSTLGCASGRSLAVVVPVIHGMSK